MASTVSRYSRVAVPITSHMSDKEYEEILEKILEPLEQAEREIFLEQTKSYIRNWIEYNFNGIKLARELSKIDSALRNQIIKKLAKFLNEWRLIGYLGQNITEIIQIGKGSQSFEDAWDDAVKCLRIYEMRQKDYILKYLDDVIALAKEESSERLRLCRMTKFFKKVNPSYSILSVLARVESENREHFIGLIETKFRAKSLSDRTFSNFICPLSYFRKLEQWKKLMEFKCDTPNKSHLLRDLSHIPSENHDEFLELIQPMIEGGNNCFNIVPNLYKIDADKRKAVMDLLYPFVEKFPHSTHFCFFKVAAKINDVKKLTFGMCQLSRFPDISLNSSEMSNILENFCLSSIEAIDLTFKLSPNINPDIVGKVARLITDDGVENFLRKYPLISDKDEYDRIIEGVYFSKYVSCERIYVNDSIPLEQGSTIRNLGEKAFVPTSLSVSDHPIPVEPEKVKQVLTNPNYCLVGPSHSELDPSTEDMLNRDFIKSLGWNVNEHKLNHIVEISRQLFQDNDQKFGFRDFVFIVYKNNHDIEDILCLAKLCGAPKNIKLIKEIAKIPSWLTVTVVGDAIPFLKGMKIEKYHHIIRTVRDKNGVRMFTMGLMLAQIKDEQSFEERMQILNLYGNSISTIHFSNH